MTDVFRLLPPNLTVSRDLTVLPPRAPWLWEGRTLRDTFVGWSDGPLVVVSYGPLDIAIIDARVLAKFDTEEERWAAFAPDCLEIAHGPPRPVTRPPAE